MKRLLLLVAAVTASCLAQGGYSGPGRYIIVNVKSNKALESAGNYVVQNNRNGSRGQIWMVTAAGRGGLLSIQNEMRGCALTLGGNGNSIPVRCMPFRQNPNQLWSLQSGKGNPLIVAQNGKALDIPNGSNNSGTRVQTYDRNGENNQRFFFQRAGGGPGPGNGMVTCSSDNGRRRVCPADTSRGVILVREYNRGACVQGRTWGYDRSGIWVDRGCSADFRTGRQ